MAFSPVPLAPTPKDPVIPTFPENCEPVRVATTELSIFNVTVPEVPPPVNPVPAVTPVISPTVPSLVIVIAPLDAEVIPIPEPAIKYEVPSTNFVSDPEIPFLTTSEPDESTSPPKTEVPLIDVPIESIEPDTKKLVSVNVLGSGSAADDAAPPADDDAAPPPAEVAAGITYPVATPAYAPHQWHS